MRLWVPVLAGGFFAAASAVAACPPTLQGTRVAAGEHQLVFAAEPSPIPLGRPFVLQVETCGPAALAKVDANMPEHRHGMNYRPSITATGEGRYRVEGMLFHMPGRWRLMFELGGTRLEHSLQVE